MKNLYTILFFTFCIAPLGAQPSIEWDQTFGGYYSDRAYSIYQTSDGGYIATGKIGGNTAQAWVIKLTSNGIKQWENFYYSWGTGIGKSIQQTKDGGYILAGLSTSNVSGIPGSAGSSDYWIAKLDSNGGIQWQKSIGGSFTDNCESISQTSDGGYIVVGNSNSNDGDVLGGHGNLDYWIVKLGSTGNILWKKALGGSGSDYAYAIQQTMDGGYIVAGSSASIDGDVSGNHGEEDYWIVKLDANGDIQWQKSYGGTKKDQAWDIQLTSDGGYIVAGSSTSNDGDVSGNHGKEDFWILKLDSIGIIQWQKALGGSNDDRAQSIQLTVDGSYIVAGHTMSNNGDVSGYHWGTDIWMVKVNETGNLLWQRTLGGIGFDYCYSVRQTNDSGYILAGSTDSYDGDVSNNQYAIDWWVVKLAPELNLKIDEVNQAPSMEVFPNPSDHFITVNAFVEESSIDLSLYDFLGRQVKQYSVQNGGSIDISMLNNGVYLLAATTASGKILTTKIRKQH